MNPQIDPQFAKLRDRLRVVSWFSNVGRTTTLVLPFPFRFVADSAAAKESIEQPEWEDRTLERGNDTTSFLHLRFRNRYSGHWNKIVSVAKAVLSSELEPRLVPALESAFPGSKVALDAVRWDLVSALMEAAYADCRPPKFFTHLVSVYEAGHLPVGWDEASEGGTLLVY
jgi:hypothetical protein